MWDCTNPWCKSLNLQKTGKQVLLKTFFTEIAQQQRKNNRTENTHGFKLLVQLQRARTSVYKLNPPLHTPLSFRLEPQVSIASVLYVFLHDCTFIAAPYPCGASPLGLTSTMIRPKWIYSSFIIVSCMTILYIWKTISIT